MVEGKKKNTIQDFQRYKEEGKLWTWSICYDYTMAGIVDESKTEMILVGDSLGNVITGFGSTIPVTLDMMIRHIKAVVAEHPDPDGQAAHQDKHDNVDKD